MSYWVRVKFDYSGDPQRNHVQEIKTNHYYKEVGNGVIHINAPTCINLLNRVPIDDMVRKVTQDEFNKVLKDTMEYLGINITNHKFL